MPKFSKNYNWVKFHHKDWLINGSIRECDAATRGIYVDLYALAMSGEDTGIIRYKSQTPCEKLVCKRLGLKLSQFMRVLRKLVSVGLCMVTADNAIILTQIAQEQGIDLTQLEPVEFLKSTQQVPIARPLGQKNGGKQPKTSSIDKNRIRKDISTNVDIPPLCSPTGKTQKTSSRSIRGSRLPEDWQPDENGRQFALKLGINLKETVDYFRDHWHAKAGKDAVKLDWGKTWKNWCRRQVNYRNIHSFPKAGQAYWNQKKEHPAQWMLDAFNQNRPEYEPAFDYSGTIDQRGNAFHG